MLTNSIYIEDQLNLKRIKLYLKRITILIKKDEIKKLIKKENQVTIKDLRDFLHDNSSVNSLYLLDY